MVKKPVTMININLNGVDGIRIESRDPFVIQIIKDYLKKINLDYHDRVWHLYVSTYKIDQLYDCILHTRDIADWRVTGALIERMRSCMPDSTQAADWVLNSIVQHSTLKPRSYQVAGVNRIIQSKSKGFLLNDDFGTGKTLQSILAAKYFQKDLGKVSILCPSYLASQWEWHIANICPELDYEILNFNKSISNSKILIIDDIHLAFDTKKRKVNIKKSCINASRVIALTGFVFDDRPGQLSEVLNLIGFNVSEKLIKKNLTDGVSGLLNKFSDLHLSYLRRNREELEIKTPRKTLIIPENSTLTSATREILFSKQSGVREVEHLLEISSALKISETSKYISSLRKANSGIKISVFSRFPSILRILKDKVSESIIYSELKGEVGQVTLYNSSIFKSGLNLDCDIQIILDPFLDSTSNIQIDSKLNEGLIVKFYISQGIDELIGKTAKYASAKKNLAELKAANTDKVKADT